MNNFEILKVKGLCAMLPENMRFRMLFEVMDKVFTVLPSLAYRVVVVCQKEGT